MPRNSRSHSQPSRQRSSSRGNIKQSIRQLVWNAHVGSQHGHAQCQCCGVTLITPFNFECGHVEARAKGGKDSVENLRPICGLCNRSMGTMNMFEFQRLHDLPVSQSRTIVRKMASISSSFIVKVLTPTVIFMGMIYYLYILNFLTWDIKNHLGMIQPYLPNFM